MLPTNYTYLGIESKLWAAADAFEAKHAELEA